MLALGVSLALSACSAPNSGVAPGPGDKAATQWDALVDAPLTLSFTSAGAPPSPQSLDFSASFTGPAGQTLSAPGYWDGGNQFAINFNPPAEGRWAYRTSSVEPSLNGLSSAVTVGPQPAGRHGALRASSLNPKMLAYADGTSRLVLGFEAGFLPALATADPSLGKLNAMLDLIESGGFTLVSLDAFARDTPWCPGATKCGPNDYGPPGVNAFDAGGGVNPAYFAALQRTVAALDGRGLQANVRLYNFNKGVAYPAAGSVNDAAYLRQVVARLAAYHVMFDYAKESKYEPQAGVIVQRMNAVRALDPYGRLETVNDRGSGAPALNFLSLQTHANWRSTVFAARATGLPVLVSEYGYEYGPGGPGDVTFPGTADDPTNISGLQEAQRALEIIAAGGYPGYYSARTAWDVMQASPAPAGVSVFRRIADLTAGLDWQSMTPNDALSPGGARVIASGAAVFAYAPGGGPFPLTRPAGAWHGAALDLTTGARAELGPLSGAATIQPPAGWSGPLIVRLNAS